MTRARIDAAGRRLAEREANRNALAGILVIVTALAAWAVLWVAGARDFVADILHREARAITGFEAAAFGAWAFGLVYLLGLGWRKGTRGGRQQ